MMRGKIVPTMAAGGNGDRFCINGLPALDIARRVPIKFLLRLQQSYVIAHAAFDFLSELLLHRCEQARQFSRRILCPGRLRIRHSPSKKVRAGASQPRLSQVASSNWHGPRSPCHSAA